jgi:hypothetical protein
MAIRKYSISAEQKSNKVLDTDGTATFQPGSPIQLYVNYGALTNMGRVSYAKLVKNALAQIDIHIRSVKGQKNI